MSSLSPRGAYVVVITINIDGSMVCGRRFECVTDSVGVQSLKIVCVIVGWNAIRRCTHCRGDVRKMGACDALDVLSNAMTRGCVRVGLRCEGMYA